MTDTCEKCGEQIMSLLHKCNPLRDSFNKSSIMMKHAEKYKPSDNVCSCEDGKVICMFHHSLAVKRSDNVEDKPKKQLCPNVVDCLICDKGECEHRYWDTDKTQNTPQTNDSCIATNSTGETLSFKRDEIIKEIQDVLIHKLVKIDYDFFVCSEK